MGRKLFLLILFSLVAVPLYAQPPQAVVITSPDGTRIVEVGAGTPAPLIVSCPDGTCGGGGGGTSNVNLVSVSGVAFTLGQKTMAASAPVVFASDQSPIGISNTTFGVTNWLGSTAPTVGQKTSANSVPVVLPSDQTVTIAGAVTQGTSPWVTVEGPDATVTYATSSSDSTVYEASRVAKASAGVLYGLTGYNSLASSQFIQIFNDAAVPANGTAPIVTLVVGPLQNFFWNAGKFGRFFSTGIVVTNSSTGPTKTLGAADCWFNVAYK